MGARVHFLKASVADVAGLLGFLSTEDPGTAERFERALETAVRRLETFPRIGHPVKSRNPRIHGIRSWPVPGFPAILFFYRADREGVYVVRVLHGARDLQGELGI